MGAKQVVCIFYKSTTVVFLLTIVCFVFCKIGQILWIVNIVCWRGLTNMWLGGGDKHGLVCHSLGALVHYLYPVRH